MKITLPQVAFGIAATLLTVNACNEPSPTEMARARVPEASVVVSTAQQASVPVEGSAPTGPVISHGAGTLSYTRTYAIFWGTSWGTDTLFTTDKIASMDQFLSGFGGSSYAKILTEYGVTSQSTHVTTIIDNQLATPGDPGPNELGHHVCDLLGFHSLSPEFNGVYVVYTTAPASTSYGSGYHSTFSCRNIRIHTVIVFNQPNAGLPGQPPPFYHGFAATAMANVTAHELAEVITDENLTSGWFVGSSSSNSEIADKCADPVVPNLNITLTNGSVFTVQPLWSNFAFTKGTGLATSHGEHGCVISGVQWPTATISGPSFIHQFQPATFTVNVSGGIAPYQYYWHFSSSSPTIVPPSGTGSTFTTELYGSPNAQPPTLFNFILDANGRQVTASFNIGLSY